MTGKRAVFLDRDGTINVDKGYLHREEDFVFIPGAPEAIRKLRDRGFLVVVVTNQSGIARGYYNPEMLHRLHRFMDGELARHGAAIDGYYFCPHHPTAGVGEFRVECDCRKPLPGMLLRAAAELAIDLGSSYMIGDKLADVDAGISAGCRAILVMTGCGEGTAGQVPQGVPVYPDLATAVESLLEHDGG